MRVPSYARKLEGIIMVGCADFAKKLSKKKPDASKIDKALAHADDPDSTKIYHDPWQEQSKQIDKPLEDKV